MTRSVIRNKKLNSSNNGIPITQKIQTKNKEINNLRRKLAKSVVRRNQNVH